MIVMPVSSPVQTARVKLQNCMRLQVKSFNEYVRHL